MQKVNSSNKKRLLRTANVCLALVLLVALSTVTFAWFKNTIDVTGGAVKTGEMKYTFAGYQSTATGFAQDFFLDPANDPERPHLSADTIAQKSQVCHIVSYGQTSEYFFIVQKVGDSIDFDFALSFETVGLIEDNQDVTELDYLNSLWFEIYDETSDVKPSGKTPDVYVTTASKKGLTSRPTGAQNFSTLLQGAQTGEFNDDVSYSVLRLVIGADAMAPGTDVKFTLRVTLNIAQTGALEENALINTHEVHNSDQLRSALATYKPGDKIVIAQSCTYMGDITITRPCDLVINQNVKLTIQGNLTYAYMYDDKFSINMLSGGQLFIVKNNDLGGKFRVDLPLGKMEIFGSNNSADGMADIYVESDFYAIASWTEGYGINFSASRICKYNTNTLMPLTVGGTTRIMISNRTSVGAITADHTCNRVYIENRGFVDSINLTQMYRDYSLQSVPSIDINSFGSLSENTTIALPNWSTKFEKGLGTQYNGNTRIKANKGSGFMAALTQGKEDPNVYAESFYSNSLNANAPRDDIEYEHRELFVEKVSGRDHEIIVHYDVPHATIVSKGIPANLGDSIQNLIEYYSSDAVLDELRITDVESLTSVTVICYGNKALTVDDYAYIRGMSALTTLDLSDSISQDETVPADALAGLAKLKNVSMPDADRTWKPGIFVGTAVEELHLPRSLVTLDSSSYNVINGIKFIYTSENVVTGLDLAVDNTLDVAVDQYFFTPNETVRNNYRALFTDNENWYRAVFTAGERYGDYVLRLNTTNHTCEFVTYTGDGALDPAAEAVGELRFTFDFLWINDLRYTILSYDDYALHNRLGGGNVVASLGSVTRIGASAFEYCETLQEIQGDEIKTLGSEAFASCSGLEVAKFQRLSTLEGSKTFYACPALKKLDMSVIEKNSVNSADFITGATQTIVEIHGEHAQAPENYTAGLTVAFGKTFVPEAYVHLYTNPVNPDYDLFVADMGPGNTMQDLGKADRYGNEVTNDNDVFYYYYVDDSGDAVMVACMPTNIVGSNTDNTFEIPETFHDAEGSYSLVRIGRVAFGNTKMSRFDSIKIPDSVTTVDYAAFHSGNHAKYCGTLDLGGVVIAADYAFYMFGMVRLVGNDLTTVGKYTISNLSYLMVARVPSLDQGPSGVSSSASMASYLYGYAFNTCPQLRVLYTGPSSNIQYFGGGAINDTPPYAVFVNSGGLQGATQAKLFRRAGLIITNANNASSYKGELPTAQYPELAKIYGGNNFDKILLSDWYDISSLNMPDGRKYTVTLPGYIFMNQNGQLTLLRATKDLSSIPSAKEQWSQRYETPSILTATSTFTLHDGTVIPHYVAGNTPTADGLPVVAIGDLAYYSRNMVGGSYEYTIDSAYVKIGDNTKKLGYWAMAYTMNSDECLTLDLNNVTHLATRACCYYNAKTLISNYLEDVDTYALAYAARVENIYLPAITSINQYTFYDCDELVEITIGANCTEILGNALSSCPKLAIITIMKGDAILSPTVTIANSTTSSTAIKTKKVEIRVPQSIYAAYVAEYVTNTSSSGWGKRFNSSTVADYLMYEHSYTDANSQITYYWIQMADGTACITDIVGATGAETFTFPSSVQNTDDNTWHDVSKVDVSAMQKLGTYSSVVLPDQMKWLGFTNADVPASIKEYTISSSNVYFHTEDGVLYYVISGTYVEGTPLASQNENLKVALVAYPQTKSDKNAFTVDKRVVLIGDSAFRNNQGLTSITIEGTPDVLNFAFAGIIHSMEVRLNGVVQFVGQNICLGSNDDLSFTIPKNANIADYLSCVWYDMTILEKFKNRAD